MAKSERQIRETRLKNLEKARAAKSLKRKYGGNKGNGFSGLGNIKSLKKNEVVNMFQDTGAIFLGFAGGKIGGELIKKGLTKKGDLTGIKSWIPTLAQLGGGFIVSAVGKDKKFVKVLGNGMMASGAVSGIETATKKSIMELVGISGNETVDGLGRTIDDVDEIHFNPNLPGISGMEIEDEDFEDPDNEYGASGIGDEIMQDLEPGTSAEDEDDFNFI